ncbi:YjbH domain-containing protein [Pseudoalteromonas luteoviolacea]|uniref:YjbH domain-containing protein n=1 Tax=Pseudoalteromonas luteoviolacea TaxID=43657 RepID=UPI001F27EF29|nr:YjbH domain-containing protein [Pseudoalteromonas luteoviolacea]MCF6439035.1 YjbH domain-containing protein [Pseudoalteromonas luteoviolacea]
MAKSKILLVSGCALFSNVMYAEQLDTSIAFAGYTGLLNTPNAEVLNSGDLNIGYNTQLDYNTLEYQKGHNFVFSAGLWEGLEVNGMIASTTMHDWTFFNGYQTRDLSFNLKYQIPLIPKDWFNLAVGARDVGGAGNKYERYYVVASKEWHSFRFSAGVATSESARGDMDGEFLGIEWQPVPWFTLLAEYDGEAQSAGARVSLPKEWIYNLGDLSLTGKVTSSSDYSEEDMYWGVNFSFPISQQNKRDYKKIEAAPYLPKQALSSSQKLLTRDDKASHQQQAQTSRRLTSNEQKAASYSSRDMNADIRKLRNVLIADGFENLRVAFNKAGHVVVKFENSVFNRNDIDALGLVLGRISTVIKSPHGGFTVQMTEHSLPMIAVSGELNSYRDFIATGTPPHLKVSLGEMDPVGGLIWVGTEVSNAMYYKPRLELSPKLHSTYATELGVYDFSLGLEATLTIPTWQGAGFSFSAQTEVAHTDDFDSKGVFRERAVQSGLNRAVFYQALDLPYGFYNLTQIGFYNEFHDYTAITNETAWVSPEGRHKIYNNYGLFDYKDFSADRDYHVVGYTYQWVEQDISFHVSAGEFWRRDSGVKVETKFWFGDSYISIFGYDTDAKVAGISFSIPLTPRKDMNVSKYGQIKGNKAWSHSVQTRISESHNALVYQKAYIPSSPQSLQGTFFNQDRLSVDYIYDNLARMKEAFETYK